MIKDNAFYRRPVKDGLPNGHPAMCFRCGTKVEVGDGVLTAAKLIHRKMWNRAKGLPLWLVEHLHCAEKFKGTFVHFEYQPYKESK